MFRIYLFSFAVFWINMLFVREATHSLRADISKLKADTIMSDTNKFERKNHKSNSQANFWIAWV